MRLVDEHRITGDRAGADDAQLPPAAPEDRRVRPVERCAGIGYGAAAMPVEVLRARDRALRPDRVLRLRDDRARRQRAHVPEGGARPRHPTARSTSSSSCGTPMCLADVRVVDEDMNECPPGVVGEIVIQGEQVLKGYWRNEEGTEGRVRGWVVPHRRHGPARRRGLLLHRRPHEGHDHHRRRERVLPRGRGSDLHPPRRRRRRQ